MRLGCLALFVALSMLWGGIQGLYTSWSSGSKRTISYRELIKEHPTAAWIRMSDASWKLIDGFSVSGTLGPHEDIYIPATLDLEGDSKTHLLVRVKDQQLADELAQVVSLPEDKQSAKIAAAPTVFLSRHPIEGIIEFGIESDDKDRSALKKTMGKDLADDYLVVQQGSKPMNPFISLLISMLGIVALGVALLLVLRSHVALKK